MKRARLFICAIAALTFVGCGETKTSSSNSSALTSAEIDTINTTLMNAVNGAETTSTGSAPSIPEFLQVEPLPAVTFSQTCNGNNYDFRAAVNNTQACPTAGHITYTGNMKTYCSAWNYQTVSGVTYCNCTGDWYIQNSLTFQFGDRTNNLNDCEVSGIILDGTVYANVSGMVNAFTMSINGSLSVNRRGPSGGLVPLDSCYINMLYRSSTRTWSGTICGRSIS